MLQQVSIGQAWSEVPWLQERLHAGLEVLLLSSRYAALDDAAIEQFAVKFTTLRERGFAECDLRWLLLQAFLDHFIELTLPGDSIRSFRTGGAAIGSESCFTLTSKGLAFSEQLVSGSCTQSHSPSVSGLNTAAPSQSHGCPFWDADRQELRYQGKLVKRFRLPCPNQAAVLSAFEEEHWPARIDDPLSPKAEQDPKRRLNDTIRNLNRAQQYPLLRFVGDGTGQGVLWDLMR